MISGQCPSALDVSWSFTAPELSQAEMTSAKGSVLSSTQCCAGTCPKGMGLWSTQGLRKASL